MVLQLRCAFYVCGFFFFPPTESRKYAVSWAEPSLGMLCLTEVRVLDSCSKCWHSVRACVCQFTSQGKVIGGITQDPQLSYFRMSSFGLSFISFCLSLLTWCLSELQVCSQQTLRTDLLTLFNCPIILSYTLVWNVQICLPHPKKLVLGGGTFWSICYL